MPLDMEESIGRGDSSVAQIIQRCDQHAHVPKEPTKVLPKSYEALHFKDIQRNGPVGNRSRLDWVHPYSLSTDNVTKEKAADAFLSYIWAVPQRTETRAIFGRLIADGLRALLHSWKRSGYHQDKPGQICQGNL